MMVTYDKMMMVHGELFNQPDGRHQTSCTGYGDDLDACHSCDYGGVMLG